MRDSIYKLRSIIQKNKELCTFSIIAVFFLLTILLMYKLDLQSKVLQYTSHVSNIDEVQMVHDFTSGMEIRQKFDCYHDFDFITLSFSDHDMIQQGKLAIQVLDLESGEPLLYEEVDASSVRYKIPVNISFKEIGGGRAGKQYEIVLMSFNTAENEALGVFGYATNDNYAILNGQKLQYTLSIGIHTYTGLYEGLVFLVFVISGLGIFAVLFAVFKCKLKEEKIFLVIAVPFVICMLLMWPGNAVYDEPIHVNTAYHYSNVILGYGEQDTSKMIMMRKCDNLEKEELEKAEQPINGQAHKYWYLIDKMWDKAKDKSIKLTDLNKMSVLTNGTIVQYLPGTVGITLGRILQMNYFGVMTLGRVMILVWYFAMCYYAIKTIPVLKMMVVFVSALPMNLYQASGISYDSFAFAVGIVVFALIIKLWNDGLTKWDWIKLAAAVFLLGQCKGGVYLTLILLMCFVPATKYNGRKWVKFAVILSIAGFSMLSSFFTTVVSLFVQPLMSNEAVGNGGSAVVEKLHPYYVLTDPIGFARMYVVTSLENLDEYLGQMLGYRTAWSNEALPLAIMLPFLIILVISALKDHENDFELNLFAKVGIFIIFVIELIGLQAIFLRETPTYSNEIIGFQGRYFIIFLPCILLLFRHQGIVFKEKREYLYPWFAMAQMLYLYFFLGIFMQA